MLFLTVILFLISINISTCQMLNFTLTDQILTTILLTEYNKEIRPALYLNVTVDFAGFEILQIDEAKQIMKTSFIIGQSWNDPRLAWKPTIFNNLTNIRLNLKRIWKPDTIIYNSASGNGFLPINKPFSNAYGNSDGQVKFNTKVLSIKTNCHLNVMNYPFDNQTCEIRLVSFMFYRYVTYEISDKTVQDLEKVFNSVWNVMNISLIPLLTDGVASDIKIVFSLKRKPIYYILNTIFPCFILDICMFSAFYIPFNNQMALSRF